MTRIEHSIWIAAPTDMIDSVALDAYRLHEWYPGIESAEPDGTYPNAGGQAFIKYKAVGITFDLTFTIQEIVWGEYVVFQIDGMIHGTNTWSYTPEGDGNWLTVVYEYELPGGGLGQLANKLVVERMNDDNLQKSLHNLKAIIEG